jgi:hypothetical protein
MTDVIREKASVLLARLDREIARADASTVAIGGITKVGTDLEALLRVAASACCKSQGSTLDAEVTRRKLVRGAGTYARVLSDARGGLDSIGEALARDLRLPKSRVQSLVDLRNANSHSSELPATYKQTLTAVAAMLRPLVG